MHIASFVLEAEYGQQTQRVEKTMVPYTSLLKDKKKFKSKYVYGGTGFEVYEGKEIFTSTMLRFSGIANLREDNASDIEKVKKALLGQMNWKADEIENIQIRNGRTWCIVYVRCAIKVVKDRCKRQAKLAARLYQQNRENRQSGADESKQRPIYRISEYIRRTPSSYLSANNLKQNDEKAKLYILNFDIINKNCHKAMTNLFLKFGDLAEDVVMGINSRQDPYAKVSYKLLEDAKRVWTYQNDNGEPKITFGKRMLTIQYAKY